jgi:hypothetical protein
MVELLQEGMWTGWVIRCIPWSDVISEQQCSFPRRQCPHSHSWNYSVMTLRAWRWTSTSLASTITRFEHIKPLWSVLETRVRNTFPPLTFLKQFEDVLQEEWYKIPVETVRNLYESIWKRAVAVMKAEGGQDHINKEMYTVSVVFLLFCPTLVYIKCSNIAS